MKDWRPIGSLDITDDIKVFWKKYHSSFGIGDVRHLQSNDTFGMYSFVGEPVGALVEERRITANRSFPNDYLSAL